MDLRTLALGRRPLRLLRRPRPEYCPKSSPAPASSAGRRASTTCPTACRSPGVAGRPAGVARRPGVPRRRARPSAPTAPGRSCWPTPARRSSPRRAGWSRPWRRPSASGPPQYALEGSVFVAGAAVQWFRDGLKAVGAAPEIDRLCLEADPDSGVLFVPALTGLGAPHWEPEARGTIFGLTRATSRGRPRPRHARRGRLPGRRPDRRDQRRPAPTRWPTSASTAGWPAPTRSSSSRPTSWACPCAAARRPNRPPWARRSSPASASASGPTRGRRRLCSRRAASPSPPAATTPGGTPRHGRWQHAVETVRRHYRPEAGGP